jgi:lysyl-tRNA synthetase class 2
VSLEQNIYQLRLDKLKQIEALGQKAYPFKYETTHTVPEILDTYSSKTGE